jgi:hypothetical protein
VLALPESGVDLFFTVEPVDHVVDWNAAVAARDCLPDLGPKLTERSVLTVGAGSGWKVSGTFGGEPCDSRINEITTLLAFGFGEPTIERRWVHFQLVDQLTLGEF